MRALLCLIPLALAPVFAAGAEAPPLDQLLKCFDCANKKTVGLDAVLDAVKGHEVVFLGETHLDESTHRLELAVYEGLIKRTKGKVVLAMEMFERDTQPALDEYIAGEIDETEFRRRARAWSNYTSGYRALIETAKRHELPVFASNAPAMLRRKVGFGGKAVLDGLPAEQRGWLPAKLYPNSERYWDRVSRVVRGHMSMVIGDTPERRLYSGQSLWDNTMGESCVLALEKYPGHLVLHINGAFHTKDREGTYHQLLQRRPETKVALLEAVATNDLPAASEWYDPGRADYLLAVDGRARGYQEGFHAVAVTPELRYRLHVPASANSGDPVPLLVWLCDGGFRARDGIDRWRLALGETVAIAAIEPPYPQIEEDLATGGRWFWGETFMQDIGSLEPGVEKICRYVMRNYPVDASRLVVAGEGTGATIVSALALYARNLDAKFLAAGPRRYSKLRTLALPGPFDDAEPSGRKLDLLLPPADEEWWSTEIKEHARADLTTTVVGKPENGWDAFVATEVAVRAGLGLPAKPEPDTEAAKTALLLLVDTPRARAWAYAGARKLESLGNRVSVAMQEDRLKIVDDTWKVQPLAFDGEAELDELFIPPQLAEGSVIPTAAGSFGGTTILVVGGFSPHSNEWWQKLEDDKLLGKRSRFHRLRVVFDPGRSRTDTLKAALDEAVAKGRRSILIVPAVFCADAYRMRTLRKVARPYEDKLTIEYRPGLGARAAELLERALQPKKE